MKDFITTVDKFWSNDFWNNDFWRLTPYYAKPQHATDIKVNRKDTDGLTTFEVIAPGFSKDDFKISIEENKLSISCSVEKKDETKSEHYTRREWHKHSFSRVFMLHEEHSVENINAEYNSGILTITIPFKEQKKMPPKTIEVK